MDDRDPGSWPSFLDMTNSASLVQGKQPWFSYAAHPPTTVGPTHSLDAGPEMALKSY
jgi:hypothetical protein